MRDGKVVGNRHAASWVALAGGLLLSVIIAGFLPDEPIRAPDPLEVSADRLHQPPWCMHPTLRL